jgi:predicted DNA-binding transcriptional regulator YafY
MNDQIIRQQQVLKLIPRHPRTTSVNKLQDQLLDQGIDVHIRTIQRDLNALSAVFIGIDNYRNPDNSLEWFWSEDAPIMNLSGLTINQALSFVMVKRYLTPLFPDVTLNELTPYFEQAESTLEAIHGNSLYQWTKKIAVVQPTQPLIPPHIEPSIHKVIRDALLADLQVSIVYKGNNGKQKPYQLNPLGLVIRNVVTYLIATKEDTSEIRMFALHRILEATVTNSKANQPKDFNLESYVNEGNMGFNHPEDSDINSIKIKAVFTSGAAKHLYETPLSNDQQLNEQEDGSIVLTATVQNTSQLMWWILGFGDQVEVLEPTSIRQKIAEIALNLSQKYNPS